MITANITSKLQGLHFEAFWAFAARFGVKTTPEALRRMIETLPEYQSLKAIRDNADPSVGEDGEDIRNGQGRQEEKSEKPKKAGAAA